MPAVGKSLGLASTLARCIPTAPHHNRKLNPPQLPNSDGPRSRELRFLNYLYALDSPTLDAPVTSAGPLRASIQAWMSTR